ncbi:AAA family ATPase [Ferroplasma sp.]|uniref:AAA family ATPase n=1 Tax=Ferroplasma sp. TaxID=2591003 RepID=UPI00307F2C58
MEEIIKEDNLGPNLKRFNFYKLVLSGIPEDVSINTMGDGFKVLNGLLLNIYNQPENSVILMEEPEVHMHPGYINEFIRYLVYISKLSNIQLYITTHSIDLIHGFLETENFPDEYYNFLKENLSILKLNKIDDEVVISKINYKEAYNSMSDLMLDLRGI